MTPRDHIDALKNTFEDAAGHLIALFEEQVHRWERYDRLDKLIPDFVASLLAGAFLDRAGDLNPDLMLVWLKEREPGLFSWQQ